MIYFRRVLNEHPFVFITVFFLSLFFAVSLVQISVWSLSFDVCK